MDLFQGFRGAHGTHGAVTRKADGPKLEIKKSASTVRRPVTEELWQQHIDGKYPLGIITINEEEQCWWGGIDVDRYDINHAEIVQQIEKAKLPMVLIRSKSGGAHILMFLSAPVSAGAMMAVLRDIAASLGFGDCEIYPKQAQVLASKGDLGNWLNMPYLGGDKSDRVAIKKTGASMTLDEFLSHAERLRLSPEEFEKLGSRRKTPAPRKGSTRGQGEFGDGPPCLEHITGKGFPEGTRNIGLFNIGVACRKKYGDDWKEKLEEFNRRFLSPPLPADEVLSIVRSLDKKEYNYTCDQNPLASHCNLGMCRTRKFGVGDAGDYPNISSLSVLDTQPALWFLDVEDQRIELTTEQLQSYRSFHMACMERLHKCYRSLKQDTWLAMLAAAMSNATVIEAPPDVGLHGQFLELLEEFLTNRQRGERQEDILGGRPWEDEARGRHYFRLSDFMKHVQREGIRDWKRNWVTQRIHDLGGDREFFNIKGKGVNVWWVPSSAVSGVPEIEPPHVRKDPI